MNSVRANRVVTTGLATSAAGVLAFATVHAILIAPIWVQALTRAPVALIAGLTMSWAYEALFARTGVQSLSSGTRFGAVLFATLVPATAFENALRLRGIRLDDNVELIVVLLLAAASGAVAGASLASFPRAREAVEMPSRWQRPAVAFAAASVGLTTLMGGPIPVVNSERATWLFLAFLPICIGASTILVVARRAWFNAEAPEEP